LSGGKIVDMIGCREKHAHSHQVNFCPTPKKDLHFFQIPDLRSF
jgi:hypothetical protein